MYQVGTAREVRAFHVMPGMEGPEGERHSHEYKLEVVVERAELDALGMVCDLDVLEAALLATAERVRDKDLGDVCAPEAEAVTVELFARWAHAELAAALRATGAETLTVRVWESPVAYGGYRAAIT